MDYLAHREGSGFRCDGHDSAFQARRRYRDADSPRFGGGLHHRQGKAVERLATVRLEILMRGGVAAVNTDQPAFAFDGKGELRSGIGDETALRVRLVGASLQS